MQAIESLARTTAKQFGIINNRFISIEEELVDIRREARATKLELLEKLAPRYITDNHEIRIQKLEETAA